MIYMRYACQSLFELFGPLLIGIHGLHQVFTPVILFVARILKNLDFQPRMGLVSVRRFIQLRRVHLFFYTAA